MAMTKKKNYICIYVYILYIYIYIYTCIYMQRITYDGYM